MSIPLAALTAILVWSTTALAVKWSVHGFSFVQAVCLRMVLGAAAGAGIMALMRWPWAWHRAAWKVYLLNGLSLFIGLGGTYWAAGTLDSGMIALLWGLMPLMTALLAAWWLGERLGWMEVAGLSLAVLGLWFVFASASHLPAHAWGVGAALLGMIALHAMCLVRMKRHNAEVHPFAAAVGGFAVAAAMFVLTWAVLEPHWPRLWPQQALAATVYLALVGNLLGIGAYAYLLQRVPASRATLITLLPPVLAMALGHWLNAEPLAWRSVAGAALVMLGLILTRRPWQLWRASKADSF